MNDDDAVGREIRDAVRSVPVPSGLEERLAALTPRRPRGLWLPLAAAAVAFLALSAAILARRPEPAASGDTAAQEGDDRLRAQRWIELRVRRSLEREKLDADEFRKVKLLVRFGDDAVPFLRGLLDGFTTPQGGEGQVAQETVRVLRDIDTDRSAAALLEALADITLIFPSKYPVLGMALAQMKSPAVGPAVLKHYAWLQEQVGSVGDADGLLPAVARHGGAKGAELTLRAFRNATSEARRNSLALSLAIADDPACAAALLRHFDQDGLVLQADGASSMEQGLSRMASRAAWNAMVDALFAPPKEGERKTYFSGAADGAALVLWHEERPERLRELAARLDDAPAHVRERMARHFRTTYDGKPVSPGVGVLLPKVLLDSTIAPVVDTILEDPAAYDTPEIRSAIESFAKETRNDGARAKALRGLEAIRTSTSR